MNILKNASWDSLQAFSVFAEEKNFTRAAARLHLSQPALHTKIGNLSRSLGLELYVRKGRQIEVTHAGSQLQRFARELVHSAAEFDMELQGNAAGQPVILTAGEGSYLYLLGDGIKSYCSLKKRPLVLHTAPGPASMEAVISARAHLGVGSVEAAPSGVIVRPLTKVGQVVVVPAGHSLGKKRNVRLKDLQGGCLVVPPVGLPHRTMISRMLQSANVDWNVAVEATGWELIVKFVQLGLGIAIVNEFCRLPKGLIARPVPELPSIQYSLFHLDKRLSKPIVELKQALLQCADSWREKPKHG